jgi:hypothetical protein
MKFCQVVVQVLHRSTIKYGAEVTEIAGEVKGKWRER